jgi:glycolate oxidase
MQRVRELCAKNGAWEQRLAQSDAERALVWKGRKAAFAAMGRVSPNYIVQDGVIPRTALPSILARMQEMSAETGLRIANVFHAGDGNLHPMVLYDGSHEGEEERALDLSYKILQLCVDAGGSITGEHGVGREKQCVMSYMFAEPDLATMHRVRHAFDPHNIANPEKLFPTPRLCGERSRGSYAPHPIEAAGVAEVF